MIVNLIYQSKNSVYTQCYSSSLYLQKDIIIAGIFFFIIYRHILTLTVTSTILFYGRFVYICQVPFSSRLPLS